MSLSTLDTSDYRGAVNLSPAPAPPVTVNCCQSLVGIRAFFERPHTATVMRCSCGYLTSHVLELAHHVVTSHAVVLPTTTAIYRLICPSCETVYKHYSRALKHIDLGKCRVMPRGRKKRALSPSVTVYSSKPTVFFGT